MPPSGRCRAGHRGPERPVPGDRPPDAGGAARWLTQEAAMGNSPPEALQPRTDGHRAEPLHRDADRLAAILATQREIATARLDLDAVMRLVAERTRALTDAPGAAV